MTEHVFFLHVKIKMEISITIQDTKFTLLPKEALAAKDSQMAYLDCPPILLITDLV
jgi:hypothetical protein